MNGFKKKLMFLLSIHVFMIYSVLHSNEQHRFTFEIKEDASDAAWPEDDMDMCTMDDYDTICDRSVVIVEPSWWQHIALYVYGKWCLYTDYCAERYVAVKRYFHRSYVYVSARLLRAKKR
jgi:hypothetical protein